MWHTRFLTIIDSPCIEGCEAPKIMPVCSYFLLNDINLYTSLWPCSYLMLFFVNVAPSTAITHSSNIQNPALRLYSMLCFYSKFRPPLIFHALLLFQILPSAVIPPSTFIPKFTLHRYSTLHVYWILVHFPPSTAIPPSSSIRQLRVMCIVWLIIEQCREGFHWWQEIWISI